MKLTKKMYKPKRRLNIVTITNIAELKNKTTMEREECPIALLQEMKGVMRLKVGFEHLLLRVLKSYLPFINDKYMMKL